VNGRRILILIPVFLAATAMFLGTGQALGQQSKMGMSSAMPSNKATALQMAKMRITPAQRQAAADRLAAARNNPLNKLIANIKALIKPAAMNPLGQPDYMGGVIPNYANSPLPTLDASGNPVPGTGIRKFVDSLPGLGAAAANDLGNYIPVASPDTSTYPGSDYYVIGLVEYTQKLHRDLPPTKLRGYVQLNNAGTVQLAPPSYLGPTIVAQKNRPVRVKFINQLPTGLGGNLFLPVDTSVMGAGMGPNGVDMYKQNRATLHLHGGATPWISDGTPNQWTTPATENTPYQEGVSVTNVPDMDGGKEPTGTLTFFYTNQQSARLMFYHDHAYGITRLNVYAGEAAPYLVQDPTEQKLVTGGVIGTVTVPPSTIPTEQIPLVIQDKTFVPSVSQLTSEDPTWDIANWGGMGNLWFPHVYMPNQNPADLSGANAMGRWDYGPWFWPPVTTLTHGALPNGDPGTPNPSLTPEAFLDTPLVNGTPYPYVKVGRKAYRFRILNASNDRTLNLQLYFASSNTITSTDASGNPTLQAASGEVTMVPAVPSTSTTWPAAYPTDGRAGGVPDPLSAGPKMVQIGSEGGFLPAPVVMDNTPVGYNYNRRDIVVLNISNHTLMLGPAERADVIVDFSGVPDGSKLILYNDAPAPVPAFDPRYDYYTGNPDQTSTGGAPSTVAGYGPNTRTIMQFQVSGSAAATFSVSQLQAVWPYVYKAAQDPPLVNQKAYGGTTDTYSRIQSTELTFTPTGASVPTTVSMQPKAIQELFELNYGRMNATLGVELPFTNFNTQTTIPLGYLDPATEYLLDSVTPGPVVSSDGTQIWKITHNGVDTHAIHFHLFNVQVINRVGWDGAVRPPDANELGWKETVRMNPLEDCIVALRPVAPSLPFKIGDSIRLLDPTQPAGATLSVTDPKTGNATTVLNTMTDFGWEYVWHCHLLGHEENDMMRPMVFEAAPAAPTTLTATPQTSPARITLAWLNNWTAPAATNNFIQRSTNSGFTGVVTTFSVSPTATTMADNSVVLAQKYYYRVRAESANAYSTWSNVASATVANTTRTLTIIATPSTVSVENSFVLSGVLNPPVTGAIVSVYVKRPGSTRFSYSSNRGTTATGAWSYRYQPTLRGTYQFYAIYGTTQSPTISVVVF
jgi:FtsP/CotA-like multicopper oxidase with cupredoxin domain